MKLSKEQIEMLNSISGRLDDVAVEVGTLYEVEDYGIVRPDDIQEQVKELEGCLSDLKSIQNGL